MTDTDDLLADLHKRAAKQPLGVDISDFSDEFCEGFLRGQQNAIDALFADWSTEPLAEALRAAKDRSLYYAEHLLKERGAHEATKAERTVLRGLHAGAVDATKDLRAEVERLKLELQTPRAEQAGNDHP